MHSSDEEEVLIPEFMKDIVENLPLNKSRLGCINAYDEFCKWKNENQASGTFLEFRRNGKPYSKFKSNSKRINLLLILTVYVVSSLAAGTYFAHGYIYGIISIALPSLRNPDSDITLSLDQETWIGSISFLMAFPPKLLVGYIVEKYGRKCVIYLSLIPYLISTIMMYFATGFLTLFNAIWISGLGAGGTAVGSIMIAEICSPKYREVLLNVRPFFFVVGSSVPHVLGKFCNWRTLVICNCIPVIYGFVVSVSSPESPAWLAAQGRFEECRAAFVWLRGADEDAELQQLIDSERKKSIKKQLDNRTSTSKFTYAIHYICDKCFMKALIIGIVCLTACEATGQMFFTVYVMDLMTLVTGDKGKSNYFAVAMDIQINACLIISCVTMAKFKLRTLLFATGILAVSFLFSFCLFCYLCSEGFISERYSWIKIALLLLFCLMRDVGLLPVVLAIWAEIFPLSHRGLGITISSLVYTLLTFTFTKTMPGLLKNYGLHMFLINAVIIGVCLVYLYIFSPETTDKTLKDIEHEMKCEQSDDISLRELEAEAEKLRNTDMR